jgi:iodotyrosine deiodinase
MDRENFEPLAAHQSFPESEMIQRSRQFYQALQRRRSVRDFSDRKIPLEVIQNCIRAAGTAPNGANLQPWHFAVVSTSKIKREIRKLAEEEEKEFYENRAPQQWLEALKPLGTDPNKPFLEQAPHLVIVFGKSYSVSPSGQKTKNYYVNESVGIATGILIQAFHDAGLATLTHTPSPMAFLNPILNRPDNERPFLILVVGYPAKNAQVPKIKKKTLDEISTYH